MSRSYEEIEEYDLRRMLDLARKDVDHFFARKSQYAVLYRDKEVLVALCQGAALHFINKTNGIKDFDVWFFYPKYQQALPCRRRGKVDFGKSKFGKHTEDVDYVGRCIDVLMRSDQCFKEDQPVESLRRYLSGGGSATPRLLAQKAVIGLYPEAVFGKVLWN